MTRILFDTNVILDVILDRAPFILASSAAWAAAEHREPFLAAHALTTIHSLIQRDRGAKIARDAIADLVTVYRVAAVDEAVVRRAISMDIRDFEDAITASAAESAGCEVIVTRDPRGFARSPIPFLTPEGLVAALSPR